MRLLMRLGRRIGMKLTTDQLPQLGMGCWAIGGEFYSGETPFGYVGADDAESVRTLQAALDSGICLFDTAAVYGAGRSERLIGKAFGSRQDIVVVTQFGIAFDEPSKKTLGDATDPSERESAIDASLRRLRRDRIDVLLLHLNTLSPKRAEPQFSLLESICESGKVGVYGWSTDFPESVLAFSDRPRFSAVEHAMNVFYDAPDIQPVINRHNLTGLIRSPLAMGVLTGKFDADSQICPGDIRATNAYWLDFFSDGRVRAEYLQTLDAVKECLRTGCRTRRRAHYVG